MTKKTKIVCTIGPASEIPSMLAKLVKAGMNIARLNFSHGTVQSHARMIRNIRAVEKKSKLPIAIMQDLQGPKIRVSNLKKPFEMKTGNKVVIGKDFKTDFDFSSAVKKGHRVLIQDGLMELVVEKVVGKNIRCIVHSGGSVESHKGVNLPDTQVRTSVLTSKDIHDLKFGLKQDVDFISISFIRNGNDVEYVRKLIEKYNPKGYELPKIIAKIELPQALDAFDEIVRASDAILIARGDLGVEIEPSKVPVIQKNLIQKCLSSGKPVIVATQMLESMIENPRPTRAEVSDVANAVIDRTDAVMLSGETAYGKFPEAAVKVMRDTIIEIETSRYQGEECIFRGDSEGEKMAAVTKSACELSRSVTADALVSITDTGYTARFLSRQRPHPPVYMLTDKPKIYRQMCLLWGITPLLVKRYKNSNTLFDNASKEVKRAGYVRKNNKIVIVAPRSIGRAANMLMVHTVK